jgi:hypothetical protein
VRRDQNYFRLKNVERYKIGPIILNFSFFLNEKEKETVAIKE